MFFLTTDSSADYEGGYQSGIKDPTEAQIREIIELIAQGKQDMAILAKDDDEFTYLQAGDGGRGRMLLEYQDGSLDKHYGVVAPLPAAEHVISAFLAFMHGDTTWRSEFTWEKMTF